MNKKVEQGINRVYVVKITSVKLNKSIDFSEKVCYYKDSRDDSNKHQKQRIKI